MITDSTQVYTTNAMGNIKLAQVTSLGTLRKVTSMHGVAADGRLPCP